mmetsp:Transcript_7828/g.13214  ORF Transcript_7828/g.13214 Transcript_7828/m.13214 type:complete len:95 (-) Transcript_7828:48-332(-)
MSARRSVASGTVASVGAANTCSLRSKRRNILLLALVLVLVLVVMMMNRSELNSVRRRASDCYYDYGIFLLGFVGLFTLVVKGRASGKWQAQSKM